MIAIDSQTADFVFNIAGSQPSAFLVTGFTGSEGLSQSFAFTVDLLARGRVPKSLIGQRASLSLRGRHATRSIHGILSSFEEIERASRQCRYQARLVPTSSPRRLNRDSRIFQQLSTISIVRRIWSDAGLSQNALDTKLVGEYGERDYCVQYQESDWDFISRLLEEEGIFYYFDHRGEEDVLILADGSHAFADGNEHQTLVLRDAAAMASHLEESVLELSCDHAMRPGGVLLRDFRFKQPALDLETRHSAAEHAELTRYYFPGEYVQAELGRRLSEIRLQEQLWDRQRYYATTTARWLAPGQRVGIAKRPGGAVREFLVVSIEHRAEQPQSRQLEHAPTDGASLTIEYRNRVLAIPIDVPFRPPRTTPRPSISGLQTAIVVGPPGEEIHCDEHGRVKLQFHWDRQGQRNSESSCWVRVSQPWAGMGYGGQFLPRVGQEVIVQFLEGDPDRPMITGRVHNGENRNPYELPNHKSRSAIRTMSTPGGVGYNELRFEDAAGNEEIFLHAQRDMRERVLNNQDIEVLNNRAKSIAGSESIAVGADRMTMIANDDTLSIQGNQMTRVHGSIGYGCRADRSIFLSGDESIVLKCGDSCITMTPELIVIKGKTIKLVGDELIDAKAKLIKLNCDEGSKPGSLARAAATLGAAGKKKESIFQKLARLWKKVLGAFSKFLAKLHLPNVVEKRLKDLFKYCFKEIMTSLLKGEKPKWAKLKEEALQQGIGAGIDLAFQPLSALKSVKVSKVLTGVMGLAKGEIETAALYGVLYAANLREGLAKDPFFSVVKSKAGDSLGKLFEKQALLVADMKAAPQLQVRHDDWQHHASQPALAAQGVPAQLSPTTSAALKAGVAGGWART